MQLRTINLQKSYFKKFFIDLPATFHNFADSTTDVISFFFFKLPDFYLGLLDQGKSLM